MPRANCQAISTGTELSLGHHRDLLSSPSPVPIPQMQKWEKVAEEPLTSCSPGLPLAMWLCHLLSE